MSSLHNWTMLLNFSFVACPSFSCLYIPFLSLELRQEFPVKPSSSLDRPACFTEYQDGSLASKLLLGDILLDPASMKRWATHMNKEMEKRGTNRTWLKKELQCGKKLIRVDMVNRTLNLGYRPSLRWARRLLGMEKTNSDKRPARQEDQNEVQHWNWKISEDRTGDSGNAEQREDRS